MSEPLPYSFSPVYPISEAISLAKRVKENPDDVVTHVKHAAGIVGCIAEKHDSEADVDGPYGTPAISVGDSEDLEGSTEEQLCDEILEELDAVQCSEGYCASSALPPVLVPVILELFGRLLTRWLGRS